MKKATDALKEKLNKLLDEQDPNAGKVGREFNPVVETERDLQKAVLIRSIENEGVEPMKEIDDLIIALIGRL